MIIISIMLITRNPNTPNILFPLLSAPYLFVYYFVAINNKKAVSINVRQLFH